MKIRRKLPKSPRSGRPLYVVGYSSDAPSLADLQSWFDLEYGGPIKAKDEVWDVGRVNSHHSPILMTHGPWSAWVHLSVPSLEAETWKTRLAWRHDRAGAIMGTPLIPRQASDAILHAARLARGLTLLTQGTAYDVTTQAYLNPADWKDRSLYLFRAGDHVIVVQSEVAEPNRDWFYTRGLSKFGLDEIETFQPVGLPSREIMERLADIADELLRLGHSPNVGLTLSFPGIGLSIQVIRHRTAFPNESPLGLREIAWSLFT